VPGGDLVDLGIDEQVVEVLVEIAVLDLVTEDIQRALERQRLLVRPVARGQGVVDVADGRRRSRECPGTPVPTGSA
jgi:hypothetical protein